MEKEFIYQVLSPKLENNEALEQAYQFWREQWVKCFEVLKSEDKPRAADFYSRDLISVLKVKESPFKYKIIGMMLHQFYRTASSNIDHHPYFIKNYEKNFLNSLRKMNIQTLMTFEYLCVGDEFRKSNSSVSIVPLLAGLCYELFGELQYEAQIAPCRLDLKINERAKDFGAQTCFEKRILHNVPVVSMYCLKTDLHKHPDPKMNEWIQNIYASKKIDSKIIQFYQNKKAIAA